MKKKLLWLAGIVCILGAAFVAWLASGSAYPRLLIGEARILTRRIPVTVDVDGRKLDGVLCFPEPGMSHRPPSRRLVLRIETPGEIFASCFLIVSLDDGLVFLPNQGDRYHKLLRNGWLLQSDAGASGVALGDSKTGGVDPDFQQSGNFISFTVCPELGLPAGRWNVRIDPNGSV